MREEDNSPGVTDTSRELPVFALPEFVLFPHTLVPFHVFEPRFCTMLDAALSGRRLVVVAGLKPGWELSDAAHAPVHQIAGLGRILSDRRFGDGRYNIFVHCLARVRIVRTHALDPFQVVDVEHVEDRVERGPRVQQAMDRVVARATSLVRELGPDGAALGKILGSTDDPGVLSNRLAAVLVTEPTERQRLLELVSPRLRCEAVAEQLAHRLLEGDPDHEDEARWVN